MNAPFLQGTRAGRLVTVLGADALVLLRFAGSDLLSGLYGYEVDCLSATPDIDFDALIGTHATVTLVTHRGEDRPFDGIVTEARWLGVGENGHRYRLTLRPWFWLATRRRNQRIFHDKSAIEILQELLSAYVGAGPLEFSTTADYPRLEYTVQYRESDFAFASRMMERFGLSYHFQHEPGSHKMVITDAAESHPTVGTRKFRGYGSQHHAAEEHFHAWAPARRITTGAVRLTDYNFKTPTAAMAVDRTGDAAHAEGQIESFDWPGDYLDQGQGKSVVARATARERGQDQRYEATGDAMSLASGLKVTLGGDKVPGHGGEFLCLVAEHSYTSDAYGSGEVAGDGAQSGAAYSGRYVLMPAEAPMLPERKTQAAVVQGPQTAVVVGEGEIDCDEYGRILVRFHWDLDAAWSMRCRVSQTWGGAGWGGMVIPRVGMEVVVEFLEGDPDKPLVTGCVYNGRNEVPYELPANKTRSTFKTKTHTGAGFNELRFEDQRGEEEIFVHAQKDMNVGVRNNHHRHVNGFEHRQVAKNSTRIVMGHDGEYARKSKSIGSGGSVEIAAGDECSIAGIDERFFTGSKPLRVDHQSLFLDSEVLKRTRPGSLVLSSRADTSISAGEDMSLTVGGGLVVSASNTVSISAGGVLRATAHQDVQVAAGRTIVLAASDALVLKCGNSSIVMKSSGKIEIVGTEIIANGLKHD